MFNNKLKAQLLACQMQVGELQGFVDAVKGGVATIIFTPDGGILEANEPFLNLMDTAQLNSRVSITECFAARHWLSRLITSNSGPSYNKAGSNPAFFRASTSGARRSGWRRATSR